MGLPTGITSGGSRSRTPKGGRLSGPSRAGGSAYRGDWKDLVGRYLAQPALLLGGLAAAALVAHACALALSDSADTNWAVARALLLGVDLYKAYLGCAAACRRALFVPPVDPMCPPSGLVLLWPFAMLPCPLAWIAWAVLNLVFGAGFTIVLRRLLLPQGGWRSSAFAVVTLFASAPFLT